MDFYRLIADPLAVSRWFLGSPTSSTGIDIDPRIFTSGVPQDVSAGIRVPLRRRGAPVNFNFCDFDMIVSLSHLNQRLQEKTSATIQRIAVTVEGAAEDFEILNICSPVKCFDSARSRFQMWLHSDGRPEKVGELRMVTELRIDPAAVGNADLFRIAEWPIALVASERTKRILEEAGATGVAYQPVT